MCAPSPYAPGRVPGPRSASRRPPHSGANAACDNLDPNDAILGVTRAACRIEEVEGRRVQVASKALKISSDGAMIPHAAPAVPIATAQPNAGLEPAASRSRRTPRRPGLRRCALPAELIGKDGDELVRPCRAYLIWTRF